MTKPTEPQFIRDPGSLFTRCICPLDGTQMHVTRTGFWEDSLHRWHRYGHSEGRPGAWKLMTTWPR